MHDPRVKVGVGMGFAVSTYGADHMTAAHDNVFVDEKSFALNSVKPLGIYKPMPATEITAEKVRNYKILENFWRTLDALGLCVFGYAPRGVMPIDTMVRCVNAITGWDVTPEALLEIGDRSVNLKRAISKKRGLKRGHDQIPQIAAAALSEGATVGRAPDLDRMLKEYYAHRGWDSETGMPTAETLARLGLDWVAEDLHADLNS